ncbi:UDP-2,4-diacetamido-2,4,6-trideoxy-beta-L-altropyranose hydrolase [Sphingomonas sp. DBB INV C78]|uniref:UDP-2,4-diacetamido-2,4, 6-trideoxy-beta-L-altropyranose hydrolase n=1 Tax=Sphingomonas sp. DBB INV C78 TaxID=3349434 RepID=UPI0036D23848
MKIAFRTDASLEIGTGHVMRCLTLADALRAQGGDCVFVCRPHRGHLLEQIRARGHEVRALPPLPASFVARADDTFHAAWLGLGWTRDAEETLSLATGERFDWLVVDHYALDRRWEEALRPICGRLMVMDDLADRAHDCDLLLDPSLGRTVSDYRNLLPMGAATLLGPQFALLRPEFAALRGESLARRHSPRLAQLLITMGGVDKGNATGRVLAALSSCSLPATLRITVIMGAHAPWLADVRAQGALMPVPTKVLVAVDDMARLMARSDMAIGAAGGTSWERCCLGLPTIQFILAENQTGIAAQLAQVGAAVCADDETLPKAFGDFEDGVSSGQLAEQSRIASLITDGFGADRIAAELSRRLQ